MEVGAMPKEVIHDQFEGSRYTEIGGAQIEHVPPFLQIGWDRTVSNVNIGTRQGGDFPDDTERPGFFVNLDRAGINNLIRTLRKARDAAFGADA